MPKVSYNGPSYIVGPVQKVATIEHVSVIVLVVTKLREHQLDAVILWQEPARSVYYNASHQPHPSTSLPHITHVCRQPQQKKTDHGTHVTSVYFLKL